MYERKQLRYIEASYQRLSYLVSVLGICPVLSFYMSIDK